MENRVARQGPITTVAFERPINQVRFGPDCDSLFDVNFLRNLFATRKGWMIVAEIALILLTIGLLLATWMPIDAVHEFVFRIFGVKT